MQRLASLFAFGLLVGCGARTDSSWMDEFATGTEDGAVNDSATTNDDGVFLPDDDVPPTFDSGVIVADAGPVSRPITCGTTTCDSATQECCLSSSGAAPKCTPKGTCTGGAALSCSSAASCAPGQQCCLTQPTPSAPPSSTCKSACSGGGPGGEIPLCTSDAECPAGTRCRRLGGGIRGCIRG